MRLKRKVRISLTEERIVAFASGASARASCPRCGVAVPLVAPEQAASLAGVSTRQVFRWLEAGLLPFVETDDPSPLVCPASLPRSAEWVERDESRATVAAV